MNKEKRYKFPLIDINNIKENDKVYLKLIPNPNERNKDIFICRQIDEEYDYENEDISIHKDFIFEIREINKLRQCVSIEVKIKLNNYIIPLLSNINLMKLDWSKTLICMGNILYINNVPITDIVKINELIFINNEKKE